MSGFEIAGVVLEAIPLIISALEHCRSGTASAVFQGRGQLNMLISRLKMQEIIFYLDTLDLLRAARVPELLDGDNPTRDECVAILSSSETGKKMQGFLGPLRLYNMLLEILERYENCLKKIVAKIRRIRRLDKAPKDDLRALLDANPPVAGCFTFKERLSFTPELGSLNALPEELHEGQLSFKIITKTLKSEQQFTARSPSHEAAKMARQLAQVRITADSLFSALCGGCTPECQTKHNVMTRLESRVGGPLAKNVAFNLVLPLSGAILQQARVKAHLTDPPDSDPHTNCRDVSATAALRPTAIRFNLPTPPASSSCCQKVNNLCHIAKKAWEKGELLQLELGANALTMANHEPAGAKMTASFDTITAAATTLEALLSHDPRQVSEWLTPKRQAFLALEIASSILQFQQTHWLSSPWSSQTIRFAVLHGKKPTVSAFIEQNLDMRRGVGPMAPSGLEPQIAILELSILLLEIWHRRSIETWALETGIEVKTLGTDNRRIAAIRWLQETDKELPGFYLDAIENCFAICSGRLRCWDDEKFQQHYCENIIIPLLRGCEAWIR